MQEMNNLTIKNGVVYLNGEVVECLKHYKLVSSAEDNGEAELTLVMDVSTIQVEQGKEVEAR